MCGALEAGETAFDGGSQAGGRGLGGRGCLFGTGGFVEFGLAGDRGEEVAAEERAWRFVSCGVVGELDVVCRRGD